MVSQVPVLYRLTHDLESVSYSFKAIDNEAGF
jgi:hypothetical protein